jgi:hypothetical protein
MADVRLHGCPPLVRVRGSFTARGTRHARGEEARRGGGEAGESCSGSDQAEPGPAPKALPLLRSRPVAERRRRDGARGCRRTRDMCGDALNSRRALQPRRSTSPSGPRHCARTHVDASGSAIDCPRDQTTCVIASPTAISLVTGRLAVSRNGIREPRRPGSRCVERLFQNCRTAERVGDVKRVVLSDAVGR